jgi:hypothetical protein
MKSVAATLLLIGSALAAGGADAVNTVLTQIASDLKDFDSAIKAYSGGDVASLTAASKKIEQTTSSGAQTIAGGADLSLTDAVGITSNVQSLQTTLDSTLSDLKSISDKLASAGQCSTILEQLGSQSKSATALQDAITSKAPAETKAVAQQLGGAIGASIDDTNNFFKKACAGAPSGGAGAASGGAPSSGSAPSSGGAPSSGSAPAAGGAPASPASPASPKGGEGHKGSKTDKGTKTSAPAKPATYTGAGASISAPILGALALAFFAL